VRNEGQYLGRRCSKPVALYQRDSIALALEKTLSQFRERKFKSNGKIGGKEPIKVSKSNQRCLRQTLLRPRQTQTRPQKSL
jgi:hypothetical protein